MEFKKIANGHYRLIGRTEFAHIYKSEYKSNPWEVSIREKSTGTLIRYAGLHATLKGARAEAEMVLKIRLQEEE